MKKLLALLLIVTMLFGGMLSAFAQGEPESTAEPETPLEQGLEGLLGDPGESTEAGRKNFVYGIDVDPETAAATVYFSVQEEASVTLRVYTDYESEYDKKLLFTAGPVPVTPEEDSVVIGLSRSALPEYFSLETQLVTVSGVTTGYKTDRYTEALQFAETATAADFPEGYYVEITPQNAPRLSSMPALLGDSSSAVEDGSAEGYIVYSTDLILLSPDTPYSLEGDGEEKRVVFESLPEELEGYTQSELQSKKGFVIPGGGREDVFLLNGGMELTGSGLSMELREPESLDDLYSAMNIELTASPIGGTKTIPINDKERGITGTITKDSLINVKIVRHGWKLDLYASAGFGGSFNLTMSKPTFTGYAGIDTVNPSGQIKLWEGKGDFSFHYKGFGARETALFYAACNNPVHISGVYGAEVYFSVGFSGLDYGYRDEEVDFSDITPLTPNEQTYVYFAREMRLNLDGFYFDFKIFEIGPVFDLYLSERVAGRAEAIWEVSDKAQVPGPTVDILHECLWPPEGATGFFTPKGEPAYGCIHGEAGSLIEIGLHFKIDLFFWDKTWKIASKRWADTEPDVDYFYKSITFENKFNVSHGKLIECPHRLYRISARTTENVMTMLGESVISRTDGELLKYSTTVTDKTYGRANPIYLAYIPNASYELKAVDSYGGEIGTETVTGEDLLRHREIIFDRNSTIIDNITISGAYPTRVGTLLYAGTDVETGGGSAPAHYYPSAQFNKGTAWPEWKECKGVKMSVRWNGYCPEGEGQTRSHEGINRCEITIDFNSYGDGTARISRDDLQLYLYNILGDGGWYTISNYEIRDKTLADGTVLRDCILYVQAEFVCGDEKYVLVNVEDGLNAVQSHFYKPGDTAIVIGKDLEGSRYVIRDKLLKRLTLPTWTSEEKEALYQEVTLAPSSERPFERWISSTSRVPYPSAFSPLILEDGTVTYNAATFIVPEPQNYGDNKITIKAFYELSDTTVHWVNVDIAELVPGQFFNENRYKNGTLSTDKEGVAPTVTGIHGEEPGKTNLVWKLGSNVVNGKIRYNTSYIVQTDVAPRMDASGSYRFRYPLASANGTKAYVTPIDEEGSKGARDTALSFTTIGRAPDDDDPASPSSVKDASARITYAFTTSKALLLEVIQPSDLYFPEGTTPAVINAYLKMLGAGIITEEESITSADALWDTVTQVPGAGESFTVNGQLVLPEDVRNEDDEAKGHTKVDPTTVVTIHIYGADELPPPSAKPEPGVYRRDVKVTLTDRDTEAKIWYKTDSDTEFALYEGPFTLNRAANETVTRTVEAYAKKTLPDGTVLTSRTALFTYTLMPADSEYLLTVIAGSMTSDYGSGTEPLYLPAHATVTLHALEDESLIFDHWELDHEPEDFSWAPGSEATNPEASFTMPSEDLTVTGIYKPITGTRLITDINMFVIGPKLGDETLPKNDNKSVFFVQASMNGMPPQYILGLSQATELDWTEGAEALPVTYGVYSFDAMYLINSEPPPEDEEEEQEDVPLLRKGLKELCLEQLIGRMPYDYLIKENDRFAPFLSASVRNESIPYTSAGVIVSDDCKRALVHFDFEFPPEYYVLRYDANGGQLGDVPRQIAELKTTPTELTPLKPYCNDGRQFLGWSTDPEATEPEYVYDPAQVPPASFKQDTTLYAVWAPYTVEIRWLDADNSARTRKAFTVSFEDGTSLSVDPARAEEKSGVGVQTYTLSDLTDSEAHTVTIEGLRNGLLELGSSDGVRNLYAVSIDSSSGKTVITLTAKRIFSVEKKWDIDFENNDKPKSVKMLLQSTKAAESESDKLMRLLMQYLGDSSAENRDAIIAELEKITGYSLKGLSPEAVAGKVMHLIATGTLTLDNLTDSLKKLLTADTDDSNVDGMKWYMWQKVTVGSQNDWKADFAPTDRFDGKITVKEDGSLSAVWNGEQKYRVVEKAGKAPVENGKDAVFTVPEYTNIVGKTVEEHKTVYMVKYSTKGERTTVTNTAVEDHILLKEWLMLGDAEKPKNVYAVLLWKYDHDYLEKAKSFIDIDAMDIWIPELDPISGKKITIGDIFGEIGIPLPIVGSIELPIAIAKLNDGNNWRGSFRIKKYGTFGLPLQHESAEFFSAICQDVIKLVLHVDLPIGYNPLKSFLSVSAPEFDVPFTTDKLDAIGNTWIKFDPDDPDDPEKPNKLGGTKTWVDNGDSEHLRPDSITLHLYEDGTKKVADIVVKRSDNSSSDGRGVWYWTYKSKSIDTKKHSYTVTEDPVEGYETKISGLNVTNTHKTQDEQFTNLTVTKIWDEETPKDHDGITAILLKNGEEFQRVTLSGENGWSETLERLPKIDAEGRTIRYSVQEDPVPSGYTATYNVHFDNESNTWVCFITNKPADPEKRVISGKKIWDDENDKLSKRPDSVTIRLYANGTEVESIVLNETNAWSWSREVDKNDAAGNVIEYTITEDSLEAIGYTASISGFTVTNTLKPPKKLSVEVIKVWNGTDAAHPEVPVTMQLLRNGEAYGETFELSEENGWDAVFKELDSDNPRGGTYAYGVKESPLPEGFTESYDIRYDRARNRLILTVTNKRIQPGEIEIGGTKTWDDEDDILGLRPVSVELMILANNREVDRKLLNANSGWSWSGIYPESDASGKISYTVLELPVRYYTPTYSRDKLSVTNTLKPATVTVKKTWLDNKNADGLRPSSVDVTILGSAGNDEPIELTTLTLTGDTELWTASTVLPSTDETGRPFTFSIRELTVNGYSVSYAEPVFDKTKNEWTFSLTNTLKGPLTVTNHILHGDKKAQVPFTIELLDGSGKPFEGYLSAIVTRSEEMVLTFLTFIEGRASVTLADGESVQLTSLLTGWRYTVRETPSYGYTVWVIDPENEAEAPGKKAAGLLSATAYPTYTTAVKKRAVSTADFYNDTVINVHGMKYIDGVPADAEEEGLFSFELLYADMTPVTDESGTPVQAVNGADGSFTLTAYIQLNEETTFYVREIADPSLASLYVLDTEARPVTVKEGSSGKLVASPDPVSINNRTMTTLTVYKHWDGADRGEVTLNLYANGVLVKEYVPERSGNTYTYTGLPRTDEKNKVIVWSAKEQPVPHYSASYSNVGSYKGKTDAAYDQGTIINRATVEIVIYKEWRGIINPPSSVTIDIYRDGEYYRTRTKKPQADGSITFTLPEYNHSGNAALYTFMEQPITGFETEYANVDPYEDETGLLYAGGTIINTIKWAPVPTGDNFPLVPLLALNLLSLFGLGVFFLRRRRTF